MIVYNYTGEMRFVKSSLSNLEQNGAERYNIRAFTLMVTQEGLQSR